MKPITKILFPTDFSECSQQALGHAVFLAEQYGAQLHMLHAILLHDEDPNNPLYSFPDPDEIYRTVSAAAHSRLAELLKEHGTDKLDIKEVQRRGIAPGPVILEYAQEAGIDLIVMGTHGRRGLGRLFLGSVAEEVVRLAKCPVLTLRQHKEPRAADKVAQILVPIDFSEHARDALERAVELSKVYDSKLLLLHVLQQPVYPQVYYPGTGAAFSFDYSVVRRQAREALDDLVKEFPQAAERITTKVIDGYPATAITDLAEELRVDLIVISTHGLTGLSHLLLGSVTEKVVRLAQCPVLTVKAFA